MKTYLIANVGESEIPYDISGYSPALVEDFKSKLKANRKAKAFKTIKKYTK